MIIDSSAILLISVLIVILVCFQANQSVCFSSTAPTAAALQAADSSPGWSPLVEEVATPWGSDPFPAASGVDVD